ncbi:unnamed protein product, partial [Brugia timori]|uniref:RHH_1 domain-containing protein n=1 Tax=Brugia timori TaxID=42155 RepID=A0A0R3QES7_9BILA
MTAKQTGQTEALFVRIPAVLKQQLAASARAKRVPLTQEVTYRLSQPSSALVTVSQLQLQHLETTAVLLRQQLSAIEELLKRISNSPLAKRSKLLRNLSTMMDESRVRREQDAEALRKRFAREEAEQAAKKAPALARIDPVWIPKPTEVTEMKERRRRNLLLHLDGRPRGARAELAIALKCEPSQISQLLSVPGAAGHRG